MCSSISRSGFWLQDGNADDDSDFEASSSEAEAGDDEAASDEESDASESELDKKTLIMGEPSPASEPESEEAETEAPKEPEAQPEVLRDALFQSPMHGNSGPPEWEVARKAATLVEILVQSKPKLKEMMDEVMKYREHCEWSLSRFGPKARAWLLDIEHFEEFVRRSHKDVRACGHAFKFIGMCVSDVTSYSV